MITILATELAQLLIVAPFIWLTLDKQQPKRFTLVKLFAIYLILRGTLLSLPFAIEALWISNINWIGKILATLFSIAFYLATRRSFSENTFVFSRQQSRPIAWIGWIFAGVLLLTIVILIVDVLFLHTIFDPAKLDWEELAFQLILPGLDEEIAYRGVMLGLLATALRPVSLGKVDIHPAVWITGLLFGLAHGFNIDQEGNVYVSWIDIVTSTVLSGALFAWMVLRSHSILTPLVMHNTIFFIVSLSSMLQ